MSGRPKTYHFKNLQQLVARLRDDLNNPTKLTPVLLVFAYNRTGKTRLSMEFKNEGKRKRKKNPNGIPDCLYFNAFTEDLFTWENDLENDTERGLRINQASRFFDAFTNEPLEPTINEYLKRYADFNFDFTYDVVQRGDESFSRPVYVSFTKGDQSKIKVSRGEQNIFIWCVFMAVAEQLLRFPEAFPGVKYLYVDDPISSLDDNHAIAVACDLAHLFRRAASREDANGDPIPLKVVFSSHHSLFFNVICNEIGRSRDGVSPVAHKRYFLHRPNAEAIYTLRATEDTPFFHHVATLSELQRAADPVSGKLYTFHFNALRSILEKTAAFFGHADIGFCLRKLANDEDEALYNRTLNLLSHGRYAIHEPTEMVEDNKELFRRILSDFTATFQFALPTIASPIQSVSPRPVGTP